MSSYVGGWRSCLTNSTLLSYNFRMWCFVQRVNEQTSTITRIAGGTPSGRVVDEKHEIKNVIREICVVLSKLSFIYPDQWFLFQVSPVSKSWVFFKNFVWGCGFWGHAHVSCLIKWKLPVLIRLQPSSHHPSTAPHTTQIWMTFQRQIAPLLEFSS